LDVVLPTIAFMNVEAVQVTGEMISRTGVDEPMRRLGVGDGFVA
jgi:hypothetical protein